MGLDNGPGRLDGVLANEQRAVAGHCVAEKALVGCFLAGVFVQQIELALGADEFLAGGFYARGQGDGGTGRQAEAQVVGPAVLRRRVGEQSLRWRFHLNDDLGSRLGEELAGTHVPRHAF